MNNFESLLFYLLSFSFSALLMYFGNKRNNKVIIGLSLAIPILISGLRYMVGTDYQTYTTMYNELWNLPFTDFFSNVFSQIEIGFFLLIKISGFITSSPFSLFVFSSFLTIIFFYLGLKRYKIKHAALVYLLYLLIIFPLTLNIVRQGVAMSISFYALSFIIERRPKQYFFWIIVASLFHISSLFLLPVYFINKIVKDDKQNSHILILSKLIALSTLIYLLWPYAFGLLDHLSSFEKYSKYQPISGGLSNTYNFELKTTAIIVLFYRWVLTKKEDFYFLAFMVLNLVISITGSNSETIQRIALYFSFFGFILLTNLTNVFNDKLGKFVVYSLLIIYGMFYFYIAYYLQGQANVIPYQLISRAGL